MLRSFKLKIALFAAGTTGLIFIAAALLFMEMVRRSGLERIDRHLHALTDAQLRRLPPPDHWSRFDTMLATLSGDERLRQFLIMAVERDGRVAYRSSRWPEALTLEALGLRGCLDTLPPPDARFRPGPGWARPEEGRPLPDALPPLNESPQRPRRMGFGNGEFSPLRMPMQRPRFVNASIENQPWRMIAMGSSAMLLVVGTNLTDYQAELRRHWKRFAVAGPVVLLLLAAGGWLLAGQALRPVRTLAEAAEGITAKGLDKRVRTPGADREFQALTDVLNGMLDRLEKSFTQAARFSADAAHELKTPLTILQGQLEQALQQAASESKEQQTYAELLEEVQRLKGIVRKLLLLAQSDSGQLRLALEPVCLNDELEAIFEDLPLIAPGLTLHKELAPEVSVMADADLLRQILQNLFSNAAKYNRPGGSIACRMTVEGGTAELVLSNTTSAEIRLDRKRLFDRFYRGDPSRNRSVEGCGLGLSLAREISQAHGGDLVLDSRESREGWVAFRLTLPTA